MEENLNCLQHLVEQKLESAKEIARLSGEALKFAVESRFEEAGKALDERSKFLNEIQNLDKKITEASHAPSTKRSGYLKKVLVLNEPDNLSEEEQTLVLSLREFEAIMKTVMAQNSEIKIEFERGQADLIQELSLLRAQKKKLMHSKRFVETGTQEDRANWNMKL